MCGCISWLTFTYSFAKPVLNVASKCPPSATYFFSLFSKSSGAEYNAGTRISYKSSPHLVFSTNYIKENPVVLPGLVTDVIDNKEFVAGINTPYQSSAHTTPYWINPNVSTISEVQENPSAKIIITDVTLDLLIPWIKIRDEVLKLGGINDNNIDIACQQLIRKNNISISNTAYI